MVWTFEQFRRMEIMICGCALLALIIISMMTRRRPARPGDFGGRQPLKPVALAVGGPWSIRSGFVRHCLTRARWPASVRFFAPMHGDSRDVYVDRLQQMARAGCDVAVLLHPEVSCRQDWDLWARQLQCGRGNRLVWSHFVSGCVRMEERWETDRPTSPPPSLETGSQRIPMLDYRVVVGHPGTVGALASCWFDSFWWGAAAVCLFPSLEIRHSAHCLATDPRPGVGREASVPMSADDSGHLGILLADHFIHKQRTHAAEDVAEALADTVSGGSTKIRIQLPLDRRVQAAYS